MARKKTQKKENLLEPELNNIVSEELNNDASEIKLQEVIEVKESQDNEVKEVEFAIDTPLEPAKNIEISFKTQFEPGDPVYYNGSYCTVSKKFTTVIYNLEDNFGKIIQAVPEYLLKDASVNVGVIAQEANKN